MYRGLSMQAESTLHRAYLLPGVFGDQGELAELRRRLQGRLDLELVELPSAGSPGGLLADMVETASAIADEIQRRNSTGAIALAGYSFGASAALATAAQLIRRGARISWLGILDGPFRVDELSGRYAELRRATGLKAAARRAAVDLAGSADGTRRMVLSAASPALLGAERSQLFRRALLTHLRNKALEKWLPPSCLARGVHISTGSYGQLNRARWAELCPNLWQVESATEHEALLKGESFEKVVNILVQSSQSVIDDTCGRELA
jgi:thioesterase domain-containing protein